METVEGRLAGARTCKAWTAWLWLLLATICVHALLPVGSPLARSSGSPFSATTIDVSIAPSRKTASLADAGIDERSDEGAAGSDGTGDAVLPTADYLKAKYPPATEPAHRGAALPPALRDGLRLAQARAPPHS